MIKKLSFLVIASMILISCSSLSETKTKAINSSDTSNYQNKNLNQNHKSNSKFKSELAHPFKPGPSDLPVNPEEVPSLKNQ